MIFRTSKSAVWPLTCSISDSLRIQSTCGRATAQTNLILVRRRKCTISTSKTFRLAKFHISTVTLLRCASLLITVVILLNVGYEQARAEFVEMVGLFAFFQTMLVVGIVTGLFNVHEESEKATLDDMLRRHIRHYRQMNAKLYWDKCARNNSTSDHSSQFFIRSSMSQMRLNAGTWRRSCCSRNAWLRRAKMGPPTRRRSWSVLQYSNTDHFDLFIAIPTLH